METKNIPGKEIENRVYKDWRREKLDIIHNYKFTIAFENEQSKNYVTEKIFNCFFAKTIPLYLGDPNITEYINTSSFIDLRTPTWIGLVNKLDNDEELYNQIINEPKISSSYDNENYKERIVNKLDEELKKEKKFTKAAVEVQMDTFFLFDPVSGNAIRWNKSFRDISGY